MNFKEITELFDTYRSDKGVFHDLMQFRVREVLLVATLYDSFILERDGQLSEQIFGEYYQLNLSTAPRITSAYTAESALEKLTERSFDLIILMVGLDVKGPVQLSAQIAQKAPHTPLVLLFNNSANLHLLPGADSLTHIDRVFVWNGYSKIFLAITKYIEDKRNADIDTRLGLVRVILLIEDSIRYYSRYLPFLYAEIMHQTRRLIADETQEEFNKILRMRGRPKVLLACSYEEAEQLFERYRLNMLAVVTDVRYCRNGSIDAEAGFNFTRWARSRLPDLPVLIQSSEPENRTKAYEMGADFIDKESESLSFDIQHFFNDYLGFGSFIFRDPSGRELAAASNMDEFEKLLRLMPAESVMYHGSRNHFSAWLMARGEVLFARIVKTVKGEDFESPEHVRRFLIDIFDTVRESKTRGRIIQFDERTLGHASCIMRFADGSIGGKGRGLSFINNLLESVDFKKELPEIAVSMPVTAMIGIDEFDRFIDNPLFRETIYRNDSYEQVRQAFLRTPLSAEVSSKLRRFAELNTRPLAVRSSGLFEDMLLQPFAGIYSTYLIPNSDPDPLVRFRELEKAVKLVYASIFSEKSRAYFEAVHFKIEEERMAVVIQEVVGTTYGNYHYPHISGTAQSYNYYPVAYLKPEDGISVIAAGLGSYVVDGGEAFRFSPRYPRLDIVSPENQMKSSQTWLYALDLSRPVVNLLEGEESCFTRLDIATAEQHGTLTHLASTWDSENNRIEPGISRKGPRILNFANILKYNQIPLAKTIDTLLEIGQKSMGVPVEIEFAVDMTPTRQHAATFHILQLRPLIQSAETVTIRPEAVDRSSLLLYTTKGMGNGIEDNVRDIIFVHPDLFDNGKTETIAAEVEELNRQLRHLKRRYILIGPGRWGTRDRWLGVPVAFNHISEARVIVEVGLENYRIDASLGSHFFHNITSMNIGYFTVPYGSKDDFIDWNWLLSHTPQHQTAHCVHVSCQTPLLIEMDGRQSLSLIRKP